MEKQKILDELEEKLAFIRECEAILASHERILDIVKTEALNLRDKYSDDRRTEISDVAGEVDIEDLIPEEESVITLTESGYIKRIASDEYNIQHRGGRGVTGMKTREDDDVKDMFICSSHDSIMLFSNLGRVYKLKTYEIPQGSRTSKGVNMVNIVPLMPGEKITIIMPFTEDDEQSVCMVTKQGVIKKTRFVDFKNTRKTGIIAIGLNEGDELSFVKSVKAGDKLLIATRGGMAIRFDEADVRAMGRTACGVRAIRLAQGDEVISMCVCSDDTRVLTVTDTGYGRISPISDYRLQSRGGKGIKNYRTANYNCQIANVLAVDDSEDVIMISTEGIIVRIAVAEISSFARPAKGVKVMNVGKDGAKVLSVAVAEHSEEDVNATPEAAEADAGDTGSDEAETAEE